MTDTTPQAVHAQEQAAPNGTAAAHQARAQAQQTREHLPDALGGPPRLTDVRLGQCTEVHDAAHHRALFDLGLPEGPVPVYYWPTRPAVGSRWPVRTASQHLERWTRTGGTTLWLYYLTWNGGFTIPTLWRVRWPLSADHAAPEQLAVLPNEGLVGLLGVDGQGRVWLWGFKDTAPDEGYASIRYLADWGAGPLQPWGMIRPSEADGEHSATQQDPFVHDHAAGITVALTQYVQPVTVDATPAAGTVYTSMAVQTQPSLTLEDSLSGAVFPFVRDETRAAALARLLSTTATIGTEAARDAVLAWHFHHTTVPDVLGGGFDTTTAEVAEVTYPHLGPASFVNPSFSPRSGFHHCNALWTLQAGEQGALGTVGAQVLVREYIEGPFTLERVGGVEVLSLDPFLTGYVTHDTPDTPTEHRWGLRRDGPSSQHAVFDTHAVVDDAWANDFAAAVWAIGLQPDGTVRAITARSATQTGPAVFQLVTDVFGSPATAALAGGPTFAAAAFGSNDGVLAWDRGLDNLLVLEQQSGVPVQWYSTDGGATWQPAVDSPIPNEVRFDFNAVFLVAVP